MHDLTAAVQATAPLPGCPLCPRLEAFRLANRQRFPEFHNDPVPSFGGRDARLLVVGLAPGLKGANRTGRPFTGDYAGEVLYPGLARHGFATGEYRREAADGLQLRDCRITNAVRCVPPENKPQPVEIATCNDFLRAEIASLPRLRLVLALGGIAHAAVLRALSLKQASAKFAHGALHPLGKELLLADSYHCSRYNMNTGRLTEAMFDLVIARLRSLLEGASP